MDLDEFERHARRALANQARATTPAVKNGTLPARLVALSMVAQRAKRVLAAYNVDDKAFATALAELSLSVEDAESVP
jgi:hypothetical protein